MKFIFLFFIASCGLTLPKDQAQLLAEDSQSRLCSFDQFIRMKQEFDVCKQTSYFSSYCYDLARVSHCSKKQEDKK